MITNLRIGEIDYNKDSPKVDLFLCRPDKTTISKITEAHDVTYLTKINTVNQLSFKIPTKIEKDRAFIHNPHIDMIKTRYLIKMIKNHVTEYFLLTEHSKEASQSGKHIQYTVYSLGYELINQTERRIEYEGLTMREMLNDLLSTTLWSVGSIQLPEGQTFPTRFFEATSTTVLQAVYDIAERFNRVIRWNTRDRKIDFLLPENIGVNRGLRFKEGKYLDSASIKIDSTETITRLLPYGKENLQITSAHSKGVPYLESYDWYMYPFKQDENGNVIQSSHYFSDDLCIALIEYEKLVNSKDGQFNQLLEEIEAIDALLSNSDADLSDLKTQLKIAWDKIDVSNASVGIDANLDVEKLPPEHWDLVAEKDRLEALLKNAELKHIGYEAQKDALLQERQDLRDLLSRENNFTQSQLKQLTQFTISREYVNDSIEDPQDLLEDSIKVFNDVSKPKITARVGIVNFLEVIEMQHDWNKLTLGDDVYIFEKDLEVEIKAKITEIIYNFENRDIQIVIENEINRADDILDKLERADGGSAIIGHDKWEWNLSKENNGMINDIINNHWDATKQAIEAGYLQLIEISERGIIVTSPDEECKSVIIQAGRIALTQDCGNTWKTAINPDGIWAEHLWGKVISGVNLIIEDESGVWITQGSRTTIYDRTYKEVMRLGLVSDEGERECFGIKSWNAVTQVELTDCVGFAISKWDLETDDWQKVLWAAPDGTIMSKNMVAEGIKIVNSIGDYIMDAEKDFMDLGALETILADLVITPMEKLELTKVLSGMHEQFVTAYTQAQDHYYSTRNTEYDFESAFDQSNGTFPVTKEANEITSASDEYLHEFTALSISYQDVLTEFIQYLSYSMPQIKPSGGNIVDQMGYVASDFLPENLIFQFGTELMRTNSELEEEDRRRITFLLQDFYDKLKLFNKKLTDMIFYSGLQMGKFYNNVIIDSHGFIAVRNDGMYRAYLNATHGLALQRWEDGKWVSKLYATLGHPDWEDGTLYAEGLVTKNLRIVDGELGEKITFDWEDGITIYGNNGEVIKLNANEAISIYTNGDKKFWVGTDGRLYAKDITTHNLKIVDGQLGEKIIFDENDGITINGNNGEQIRLNANEGIAIDVNSDKRIWIGKDGLMYAKKLYIMGDDTEEMIKDVEGSYISDLTVNRLKTLNSNAPQDFVHIEDNYIKFKTSTGSQELTKLSISFEGVEQGGIPMMRWGAGAVGNPDANVAIQRKDNIGFYTKYMHTNTEQFSEINLKGGVLELNTAGEMIANAQRNMQFTAQEHITFTVGSSKITISPQGVKINGQRIDLN